MKSEERAETFADLYREAERHEDYWVAGTIHDFTEELHGAMEAEDVSRSELARRLGSSPAYVTKILRGNANFTLATMVKLARAVGAELEVRLHHPARTYPTPEAVESFVAEPSPPYDEDGPEHGGPGD